MISKDEQNLNITCRLEEEVEVSSRVNIGVNRVKSDHSYNWLVLSLGLTTSSD